MPYVEGSSQGSGWGRQAGLCVRVDVDLIATVCNAHISAEKQTYMPRYGRVVFNRDGS